MKKYVIKNTENGIRLDKYIKKVLPKMPFSTYHKLLRKNYFKINGRRTTGDEILNASDEVEVYMSDETIDRFSSGDCNTQTSIKETWNSHEDLILNSIIYEDDNIIIYNKKAGILSQGDKTNDISVNELLREYVSCDDKGQVFKPTIVNRLDRNTRGIVIFAKTYLAAKCLSDMIKNGDIDKKYVAVVNGILNIKSGHLRHLYKKDEKNNIAIIREYSDIAPSGYSVVELTFQVIKEFDDMSIMDIRLLTGKSHQIRAQLSYIGHPIVCDKKYMDIELFNKNIKYFKTNFQLLCCYKVKFGTFTENSLSYLNHKEFSVLNIDEVTSDYRTLIV